MASPSPRARLLPRPITGSIILLLSVFPISGIVASDDQTTLTPGNARPEAPIMVWRGRSDIGYLRAELWSRPTVAQPFNQDLVVRSASVEHTVTYSGLMVQMPTDIKTEPSISQVFVRTAADGETRYIREASILAALSDDGTLRLYGFGVHCFLEPCVLKAVE